MSGTGFGPIGFIDITQLAADLDRLLAGLSQQNTESFTNQQALTQGVVNTVTVVISDTDAITTPSTILDGVTATAPDSVTTFGETSAQLVVMLANETNPLTGVSYAQDLSGYLIRQIPNYWFSNIEVSFNALSDPQRDLVAVLEIGDQILVSKRFPNVTNPVVETLFVEGISHKISPSNHTVVLQCSPAELFTLFILDTNELDDNEIGLG